ncbi:TPA: glycosyltransferase family 39 protein [archaeon]|nr:glycosyltransferase family 39 protein [Candidatus Naiadarchaeales archaeon SRR2090159.bin1288]
MTDKEENSKKEEKKEETAVTFSASDFFSAPPQKSAAPKQKEEKPQAYFQLPPELKDFLDKVASNRKNIIYGILLLIIAISAIPRMGTVGIASLAPGDPFWQYRHANEIYEHGYPGTEIRQLADSSICFREPACTWNFKAVYWDTLHDAPEGAAAPIELYPYFVAYSYKYFAKIFFSSLLDWIKVTPVLFSALTAVLIFLLGREIKDEIAGLAAAFVFSFSTATIASSYYAFADSNAIVLFMFVLTVYLSFKAWTKKSLVWGAFAGVSLGLSGMASPSSYVFLPIMLIGSAFIFFIYRFLQNLPKKSKEGAEVPPTFREAFLAMLKEDYKHYLVALSIIGVGLAIVALVESPFHANIARTALNLLQIKAAERSVAAGTSNVFLTVVELRGADVRTLIYLIHASIAVLLAIFGISLFFNPRKKLPQNRFYAIFIGLFFVLMLFAVTKAIRASEFLMVPASLIAGLAINGLIKKMDSAKLVRSAAIVILLFGIFFALPNANTHNPADTDREPFVQHSLTFGSALSEFATGHLPPPFTDFYSWARENTPEGTIFASWWDHGHEFTALAQRPIVADGSQSFQHVNDLAKFFTSTNSTEALLILKEYNVSYVFTSADMFAVYGSITQIASGKEARQAILPLSQIYSLPDNSTNYVYSIKGSSGVTVVATVDSEGDADAKIIAKYNSTKLGRIYYVNNGVLKLKSNENDKGNFFNNSFYFTSDYALAVPLLGGVDDTMLVRLQLLDAFGMEEHFELVKSFSGVVKVYKIHY